MREYEEQITEETPLTLLIDKEEPQTETYRECAIRAKEVINAAVSFILQSGNPKMACLGVAYAMRLPEVIDLSMRDRAIELGLSHSTIQGYHCKFLKIISNL